jgi:hypothetical protein
MARLKAITAVMIIGTRAVLAAVQIWPVCFKMPALLIETYPGGV